MRVQVGSLRRGGGRGVGLGLERVGVEGEDEEGVLDDDDGGTVEGVESEEVFARDGPGIASVARAGADAFSGGARLGVLCNGPDLGLERGKIKSGRGREDVELVEVVVRDDDDVGDGVGIGRVDESVDGDLGDASDAEYSVGKPKARRAAWSAGGTEQGGQGGSYRVYWCMQNGPARDESGRISWL